MFGSKFLINQDNALEKIAFLKYPKLKKIKSFLENLKTPLFVRMTGSGSVIVAYYQSKRDCELAKVQFKRKFKNYWCNDIKNYINFNFLCYTKTILGRSQVVRHWFLVPAS